MIISVRHCKAVPAYVHLTKSLFCLFLCQIFVDIYETYIDERVADGLSNDIYIMMLVSIYEKLLTKND